MELISEIIIDIISGIYNALTFVLGSILNGSPYILTFVLVFLVIGLGALIKEGK